MFKPDIAEIARHVGLEIVADGHCVEIKQKFRWRDKANLGVLFFLLGGIALLVIPLVKPSYLSSKIAGIAIGMPLLVFSILTLVRQLSDRVRLTERVIVFRYKLRLISMPIDKSMTITMLSEKQKFRRAGTVGSAWVIITHYLQTGDKKIPILHYQTESSNAENALRLGDEITRILNRTLQHPG